MSFLLNARLIVFSGTFKRMFLLFGCFKANFLIGAGDFSKSIFECVFIQFFLNFLDNLRSHKAVPCMIFSVIVFQDLKLTWILDSHKSDILQPII